MYPGNEKVLAIGNLLVWVLYYVPEGILVMYVGLGLLRIRPRFRTLLFTGMVFGASVGLARTLPLPIEARIPIIIALYALFAGLSLGVPMWVGALGSALANFLLTVGEVLVVIPVAQRLGLAPQETLATPLCHILFGWLSCSVLLLAAMGISKGLRVANLGKFGGQE